MNWSNVKLILAREIRDQLRDRRTLFMIAVLPLLLYPLLGMSFFQIAQFMRVHATKVLVLGSPEVSELGDLPPLVERNRFSGDLFSTTEEAELLELSFPREEKSLSAKQDKLQIDQARQALQAGDFQLVLYFPPDFGRKLESFRERLAKSREGATDYDPKDWEIPSPKIFYNTASEKSQIAYNRVSRVLDHWSSKIGEQNLEKSNVPIIAARPFGYEKSDVASKQHRDAAIWSKVLPFVLLIWALTGAFYPAIDLCAGEKERGTLETLLSSPAERSEIVWGKLLTVMIFSVATAALNLLSMGVTGTFVVAQMNQLSLLTPGGAMNLPPASAMIWLVAALLPVSALFSALCLALAAFARSTKEGQYYLMPLVLITMPLMILPMAPGVELTLGNSLIPITGVVLLLRAMLEGNYMQGLLYVVPVALVTLSGCLLSIRWAIDQFNSESVLFRESERLDLGLWIRHVVRDRGPTPTIAAAITCFVAILLIQFFMNLALPEVRLDVFGDIAQRVFVSLVVFIAFPALLMTIMFTRDPRRTLLLHKWPPLASVPVALLLAVVLHPLVQSMGFVVQKLYPMSDAMKAHAQVLGGLFENAPYAWLPFLLIAVLPAICEEIAFRGFILSGLRHIGHKWWAIGLSAIFFGVAHGVLQQSIMASMLGVLLGYIAVQTGSLLPCIAYHMAHNGLALLSVKLPEYFTPELYEQFPQLALLVSREIGEGGAVEHSYGWPLVVAGAAIGGYLLTWLYRLPYSKTAEEQHQDALEHQNAGSMVSAGE